MNPISKIDGLICNEIIIDDRIVTTPILEVFNISEQNRSDELTVDGRRKRILEIINREGKARVADLSRLFGISEVTIRNDLSELEKAGVLDRIHGGAISTYKAYYQMSLIDRMNTNTEEKKRIAAKAASMITDGDTVMISSGTTTLFAVRELKDIKNLTVVTNSLSIAQEVGPYTNIQVILLGGNYDSKYQFTFGDDTLSQLKRYRADKLILSADGVSCDGGVSTYHHLEAEISRQMIARVNHTIVAADYSKVGRASFACIGSLNNIDTFITNPNANSEEIRFMREKGVEVFLV